MTRRGCALGPEAMRAEQILPPAAAPLLSLQLCGWPQATTHASWDDAGRLTASVLQLLRSLEPRVACVGLRRAANSDLVGGVGRS